MDEYPNASNHPRVDNLITLVLRFIILASTVLAVICLIVRHYYKNIWLNSFFNRTNDPFSPIFYDDLLKQYSDDIVG
jgi:hypothetical protein